MQSRSGIMLETMFCAMLCCGISSRLLAQASSAQAAPTGEDADFQTSVLWTAGVGGYATYRIPGIVMTKRGVLLAYTSARHGVSDWADIDVVMRRSLDHGQSWTPSSRLLGDSHGTTDNPVAIVDYTNGAVHFLFQRNYERCFYMRSDDDGKSFSQPVDITPVFEQFRSEYDWRVIAPGVGHAIQLQSGRLLVPVWMSLGTPTGPNSRAHRPSAIATIYSDDHGKSWKRGAIIANSSEDFPNPSEAMAVQLPDGKVYLSIRNEAFQYRRAFSISPDGISGWSKPQFIDNVFDPICEASILRLVGKPGPSDERILFSNPDSEAISVVANKKARPRQMLTIRMSLDGAKTWPLKRVLDPGVAGYSDLATDEQGNIFVLWEEGAIKGSDTNNVHTMLARFPLKWLQQGQP